MIHGFTMHHGTKLSGAFVRRHSRLLMTKKRHMTFLLLLAALFLNGCRNEEKLSLPPEMLSFGIKNISAKASIDHQAGIVEMTVPFGTVVSSVVPEITINVGANIVPAASVPQDFRKSVYYTITAGDGSKKVYKVTLTTSEQPFPEILSVSSDTIKAGDTLQLRGRNFGISASALTAFLKERESGSEVAIPFLLIDSTRISLLLPTTTKSTDFYVIINKNKLKAVSQKTVHVRIHDPVISAIRKRHILQGDTLLVAGNFVFPSAFNYALVLTGGSRHVLAPLISSEGKLGALLTDDVIPGAYSVSIANVTEKSNSAIFKEKITVYDKRLPFIKSIVSSGLTYSAGQVVRFGTINFGTLDARFYSIQLTGNGATYSQNGIYSKQDQMLSVTIPQGVESGRYEITISLLNDSGTPIYEFGVDDLVTIN